MNTTPDARALTLAFADDARNRAGEIDLPSAEELLAYHEGRLDPEREAALGRILVASPEAARRLLDVVEPPRPSRPQKARRPISTPKPPGGAWRPNGTPNWSPQQR